MAFYVIHELPDQDGFFREIHAILNDGGQVLVAEPPFHVSKAAFAKTLEKSLNEGFEVVARPRIFPSKAALLKKSSK